MLPWPVIVCNSIGPTIQPVNLIHPKPLFNQQTNYKYSVGQIDVSNAVGWVVDWVDELMGGGMN